jgi:Heavy-metal resistance
MKRAVIILIGGLVLGLAAGFGAYHWRTAPERAMMCSDQPELSWLQHEYKLNDAEFARISKLHNEHLTRCNELCERIAATNSLVRLQIGGATNVTPEMEKLLNDAAALRVECQKQMLAHFLEVSKEMPAEQGRRYLAWVQDQIFSMSHEPLERTETIPHHGD